MFLFFDGFQTSTRARAHARATFKIDTNTDFNDTAASKTQAGQMPDTRTASSHVHQAAAISINEQTERQRGRPITWERAAPS